MELRQELLPPALDSRLLVRLEELFQVIMELSDAEREIEEFNRLTGKDLTFFDFVEYYEYTSADAFIQVAATLEPPKLHDITKEEFIEIIKRIISTSGSERDSWWYRTLLYRNVAHPHPTDLIFHNKTELTAEKIVDEILAYQPIVLSPPKES
jgi:Colicin immunity protein / pyocin immunity protein